MRCFRAARSEGRAPGKPTRGSLAQSVCQDFNSLESSSKRLLISYKSLLLLANHKSQKCKGRRRTASGPSEGATLGRQNRKRFAFTRTEASPCPSGRAAPISAPAPGRPRAWPGLQAILVLACGVVGTAAAGDPGPGTASGSRVLVGDWYVLIHHRDLSGSQLPAWDDQIWRIEADGPGLRWSIFPHPEFQDGSGRWEKLPPRMNVRNA